MEAPYTKQIEDMTAALERCSQKTKPAPVMGMTDAGPVTTTKSNAAGSAVEGGGSGRKIHD